MIVRLANVIYALTAAVSVLLIAAALGGPILGTIDGTTQITLAAGAVLIWLAGRAVLYVFAGR